MESKGYKLLSTEMCKSNEKMDYVCLKHIEKGVQHISIYHIMDGRGCYYCGREKTNMSRRAKINKDDDKALCESRGFEYVDTVVENNIVYIDMICPRHRHVGVQRVKKGNLKRDNTCYCVYCIGRKVHPIDSFGYMHPEALNLWSDKNEHSPFEYSPNSNQKVWFKCENELHDDYMKTINDAHRKMFRCPKCYAIKKESYLQHKVRLYFNDLGYNLKHEYACSIIDINPNTGCKMPYDNQEDDILKLIVEVHGKQHYEIDKFTIMQATKQHKTPEEVLQYQQWKDLHKKDYAMSNGYHYLEVPYWAVNNDEYKQMIDDKIQKILNEKNNIRFNS